LDRELKFWGNVIIGDDSKIGANAVVLYSVDAGKTVAGIPQPDEFFHMIIYLFDFICYATARKEAISQRRMKFKHVMG